TQPPGTARPLDPDLAPALGTFGPPDPAYDTSGSRPGGPPAAATGGTHASAAGDPRPTASGDPRTQTEGMSRPATGGTPWPAGGAPGVHGPGGPGAPGGSGGTGTPGSPGGVVQNGSGGPGGGSPGGTGTPGTPAARDGAGARPAGPLPEPSPPEGEPEGAAGRRIALSASLGRRNRPRALSCSLVLSVAGALAVVGAGAYVFDLIPHGGGGTPQADGKTDRPPATGKPDPGDSATEPPSGGGEPDPEDSASSGGQRPRPSSSVSPAFVGTWKGDVTQRGGVPAGTMTATIRPGIPGEYVIRVRYDVKVLSVGVTCYSEAKLTSANSERITGFERSDPDRPKDVGCTGEEATVTFTRLDDGRLGFSSQDESGGLPTARLSRVDGG
ncbi:hypothetical protein IHE55_30445, partial [Streptomyces pactum]|nr:hypothetical protein [Streptomyces pactum]